MSCHCGTSLTPYYTQPVSSYHLHLQYILPSFNHTSFWYCMFDFLRKLPNLYFLILQHLSWMIFHLLLFYHYNLFVLYPLVLNKLNLTMLILNSPIVLMPITSHNMYLVHQPYLARFDPTGSLHYTPWIQYSLHWSCYLTYALSYKVGAFEGEQLWCWQCVCGS